MNTEGDGIKGAQVKIAGQTDTTDNMGAFSIDGIETGSTIMTVTHDEYEDATENINIEEDGIVKHVELQKEDFKITEIEDLYSINVEYGTDFEDIGLPEKVNATLEDGSTRELDVTWIARDYDGESPDIYTIQGELELTEDIINPDDLKPSIEVIVQELDATLYQVSANYNVCIINN